jgi:hypothetical protein
MTKDKALNLALEAITRYLSENPNPSEEAVEGLCDAASFARKVVMVEKIGQIEALSTPQQRPWVGLTDEEIQTIHDTYYRRMGPNEFARAIEAALRSKNT